MNFYRNIKSHKWDGNIQTLVYRKHVTLSAKHGIQLVEIQYLMTNMGCMNSTLWNWFLGFPNIHSPPCGRWWSTHTQTLLWFLESLSPMTGPSISTPKIPRGAYKSSCQSCYVIDYPLPLRKRIHSTEKCPGLFCCVPSSEHQLTASLFLMRCGRVTSLMSNQ